MPMALSDSNFDYGGVELLRSLKRDTCPKLRKIENGLRMKNYFLLEFHSLSTVFSQWTVENTRDDHFKGALRIVS